MSTCPFISILQSFEKNLGFQSDSVIFTHIKHNQKTCDGNFQAWEDLDKRAKKTKKLI